MDPCLTKPDLDRYHAGDLTEAEEGHVRRHLAECEDCTRRDAELVAEHKDLAGRLKGLSVEDGESGGLEIPSPAADPVDRPDDQPETMDLQPGNAKHETGSDLSGVQIEGYEIIRELHRGGQGVVYQAIQKSTKRKVAIKVLLEGPYASESAKRRFEREIELVASLKHPNVISIFHSGQTSDGRQFCVMDYVRGLAIHQYVRDKKLTLEEALKLFATVCEAVNYAHQKGVIHRDLKPSNILVDSDGAPKVLDFGLAKTVGGPEQTLISMTGQVLGTLPYMSPEQTRANPDEIDIRTDVYALGVILYEMLTGQYPYPVAGQMAEVFKHIAETPPTPPTRSWNSDTGVTRRSTKRLRSGQCPIDDEVQTIVLKSLAKERDRRYQGAGELARDVGHYLLGEPIEAKRDSVLYVLGKQLRRYRAPVAAAAAFVILLVVATVVTTGLYFKAEKQAVIAQQQTHVAEAAEQEQRRAREEAEVARAAEEEQRKLADQRAEALRRALYSSFIARAQNAFDGDEIATMKRRLAKCPSDLRGWEWERLRYISDRSILTLRGHKGRVAWVAFSPDGTRIVSGSEDKSLKVWDTSTGENTLTLRGHGDRVSSVAFSPDGTRIVSGSDDDTLKVWDASTGENTLTLRGHERMVTSVAFNPDGTRIVSGSWDKSLKVWDASTGENTLTLRGHKRVVSSVAFSPDGTRIVSGSWDKSLKVWDASTGENTLTLRGHNSGVSSVAFNPDGTRIVSGGTDETLKVWDASTGENTLTLRGHEDLVSSVAFNPDGTRIVSGSSDKSLKVWDSSTEENTLTLRGHKRVVSSVAFNLDGTRIVSGSMDKTLKLWDTSTGENTLTLRGHEGPVYSVSFSPDGTRIVSGSADKTLKVWDASTGENTLTLRGHNSGVSSVAFNPDGTRIVSGSDDQMLKVWETKRPPPGVPAARRAVETARRVVTSLYEELLLPDAVMEHLRTDESLAEPVRRAALRMAKNYPLGGYAWELNAESWQVVAWPDEAPEHYRAALKQAQAACQLSPNDGTYLNTLGVAKYRVGEYAAALETLTRSDEMNSKRTPGAAPVDVAFLAMSLHRLGRDQEATAALARLRELMQQKRWTTHQQSDGFLKEAESLIMGVSPSPAREE